MTAHLKDQVPLSLHTSWTTPWLDLVWRSIRWRQLQVTAEVRYLPKGKEVLSVGHIPGASFLAHFGSLVIDLNRELPSKLVNALCKPFKSLNRFHLNATKLDLKQCKATSTSKFVFDHYLIISSTRWRKYNFFFLSQLNDFSLWITIKLITNSSPAIFKVWQLKQTYKRNIWWTKSVIQLLWHLWYNSQSI